MPEVLYSDISQDLLSELRKISNRGFERRVPLSEVLRKETYCMLCRQEQKIRQKLPVKQILVAFLICVTEVKLSNLVVQDPPGGLQHDVK